MDQEFFKRVRAAYYVVSGNDPGSGEPSRGVLDALLEGKSQWGSNLQVFALSRPGLQFKHIQQSIASNLISRALNLSVVHIKQAKLC